MRVPLSWLRQYTPIEVDSRDRAAVRELGRSFDSLGLVVEEIIEVGAGLEDVVLARVLEIGAIAGADRVRRVLVDAGAAPLEIVCGASNFAPGDVVPLAPVGATLPGGVAIARRTMRGVTSNGMLCSGRELGLGDDGAGLMILASPGAPGAPLAEGLRMGTPLMAHLGIEHDVVFDLAVEPNRPDCLSIVGIARDIAARLGLPFSVPTPVVTESATPVDTLASIAVEAPAACHHLLVRVLTRVAAVPSPPLVARRLTLAGMRPINAIVDASNYVMLELGQPTHPYDLDRLPGSGIRVRLARPGERLVTLDGVERTLGVGPDGSFVEDCVICDANDGVVGIAGVMGGSSSEISEGTSRILLEVAQFAPLSVGRSAARLGLRTEAFSRFWRGVDPEGLGRAADRFCELVADAMRAAGRPEPALAAGVLDEQPIVEPRRVVPVRTARLNALLGTELSRDEIAGFLAPIGFGARAQGEDLAVTVPSFRPDTVREVDVIEEVARHLGYEKIAHTARRSPYVGRLSARQSARRSLERLLAARGVDEAWTSSIVDPELVRRAGEAERAVELANPIVREESVLRTHLLPGLLAATRYNVAHGNGAIRLFEIGRVFLPPRPGEERPIEREQLGVLLAGAGDDAAAAVALWRAVVEGLRIEPAAFALDQGGLLDAAPAVALGCHPSRSALIVAATDAGAIGALGEVDPEVLAVFDLPARRVGWLALDVDALLALARRSGLARPVSRFPPADLDLAFELDEAVAAIELEGVLRAAAGELLESLRLIDVYRGPGLSPGTRSLAYRLRLRALGRTLTDAEVAELRSGCIAAAQQALPARLRA